MRMSAILMAAVATSLTAGGWTPASATTVLLTFDQGNSCVPGNNLSSPPGPCTFNGTNISPTYGSTPLIGVSYRNFDALGALSQSNLNWTDEGFGQGSAYATGSNGPPEDLEFIFTPISGYEVSLSSIESWVNSGVTPVLASYTLFNDTTQIGAPIPFAASPSALDVPHTVTNLNTGYFSGPLRLHVTPGSSRSSSFDNIGLDVRAIAVMSAVPEPATWLTMILGFGLIGGVMRRRRGHSARLA